MINTQDEITIKAVYETMQASADGEDAMVDLFTDDNVLIESFTGATREHAGKAAIRECYRQMMMAPRP